ncbi:hypothetical protein N7520_005460 [Penicillium odoratum]|uniref:uncharacterized protein n=1 Tax=Penicillium odoratum TaxID=1167516 RepID=UPI00254945B6|nr:uncharacterized protein N7520_005460 [Penicillium odoratum]KAJ5765901.1 hypothetical protein N7520_005460 [Penicillium odoratum]
MSKFTHCKTAWRKFIQPLNEKPEPDKNESTPLVTPRQPKENESLGKIRMDRAPYSKDQVTPFSWSYN